MTGDLERFASKLEGRLGRPDDLLHLSPEVEAGILELAAVVAHGSERKNAPLAAFLVGRLSASLSPPQPTSAILSRVIEDARTIFTPEDSTP